MKTMTIFLFTLLLLTNQAQGQTQNIQRLDGTKIPASTIDYIISGLMRNARVTGLNLAILNNYRIVYEKSYGYKNKETGQLMDTATVLYGASLSKAVFACLCMQLIRQGILNLDKPLWQYLDRPLPDYDNYKDLKGDDRWKLITARMCLSHTTGFPNWRFLEARTGKFNRNGKLAIYFTPGSKYAYSGEGMALLQMVVEKITGKRLEELAREKFFNPLGMSNTSYVYQPRFEHNYALGYNQKEDPLQIRKWKDAGAAGSMETTLADYARFVQYIMTKISLHDETMEMMISPQIQIYSKYQFPTVTNETTKENETIHLSYGLGWGLLKCDYGHAFFKEGHDDGWEHYNINFADKGISVIIMTNSSNGESIFKELLEKTIGDTCTPWKWERYVPYNLNQR